MRTRVNFGLAMLSLIAVTLACTSAIPAAGSGQEPQADRLVPPAAYGTPSPSAPSARMRTPSLTSVPPGAPTSTSAPTHTRVPARTPTGAPKGASTVASNLRPTSASSQVFNFDEIFYSPGGGGGGSCTTWTTVKDFLPASARLPYVWTDIVIVGTRLLCAYGFAPDEALTLELYTPDGKIAATYILPAIDNTDALEGREIAVNIPYSLPYGSWTAVVRDRSLTARDSFTHPDREVTNIDLTHLLGAEVLHPSDPRWRMDYKQGDLAAITGVGFQANSTITVVVARSSDVYAEDKGYRVYPLIGWNVQVDARGDFYIQFSLDRSFTDGDYLVLANPKSGRSLENESWLFDIEWYKVFSPWRACRLGPLSGLHKGGTARLNVGPPNNLRDEPRVSGRKIGQIQELQSVTILDGPMCSDGMTWWFVEVIEYGAENYGLKGWTAEGDASAYWLVPGW